MKFGKIFKLNTIAVLVLTFLFVRSESTAKSFLWEIKSDKGTVYLLGSIHMGKKDMYPLPTEMELAFAHSDTLVVEVKMDNVNPFVLLSKATYPDSTNLKKNISPELFAEVKKRFADMGVDEEGFINYKPWYASIMLTMNEAQGDGYDAAEGIDIYFMNKAKKNYKPVDEIESFNEQLAVFDSFDKQPDAFLKYSMEDFDNTSSVLDSMVTAWKEGDSAVLNKLITQSLNDPAFKEIKEVLFDKRNIKMAGKIEGYLESPGTHFVIVGAGHIVGENGIISLLSAKKIYSIKQM